MKYGLLGDIHLTDKTPRCRKDSFSDTQMEKIHYIWKTCKRHEVDAIFQPGDFVHHHSCSDRIKRRIIQFIRNQGLPVLTVPGQHDMRYHSSTLDNTPIGVIEAAEAIDILDGEDNIRVFDMKNGHHQVAVYGAGWNRSLPEIPEELKDATNILLTHRMVIKDKLWGAQEDFERMNVLLRTTDFNLILSGDNHNAFFYSTLSGFTEAEEGVEYPLGDSRILINCGSLMRSNIDQFNHRPQFWIYDTVAKTVRCFYIPVLPVIEVMDVEKAKEEKRVDEKIQTFVRELKKDVDLTGMEFEKNLAIYMAANSDTISKEVADEIANMMEVAHASE